MSWEMEMFVSMLLLVFAIGTIIAGAFTVYFGSGKSRAIGSILFLLGIIVGIVFYNYSGGELWGCAAWSWTTVKAGVLSLVGGIVGALIAVGVFLAGIMKA
ncbi:MAG TPA: hypothetical protein ENG06_02260 [Thermoplasmatales archaeon]|nr:MAG: hypothetical protein FE046_00935 [Thermoplasmata archaeon]RLF33601.1 MAG: hypothetical protein DRN07_02140 [Thermoplasmata archaeon]HDN50580.1 hypothetical protein [Thermoplasmatales archaeon]